MKIIGISSHRSGVHDNSAVLIEDGKVIFAEAEERLSRVKHDGSFPYLTINEALKVSHNKIKNIDYFYSANPEESIFLMFLTSLRLLPVVGFRTYIQSIINRFRFKTQKVSSGKSPKYYVDAGYPLEKLVRVSHYLAHAAAAAYTSPYDNSMVIAMDGFGPGENGEPLSGQIYKFYDNKLETIDKVPVWGSLGLYYGAVTKALGFKLNDGEGKTMGLAAYGNSKVCYRQLKAFFPEFKNGKWKAKPSIMDILNIQREEVFIKSKTLELLHRYIDKYGRENVSSACQLVFEEEIIKYVKYLVKRYKIKNLVLVGGIFLNVKANMRIFYEISKNIFIYPNPADGGTAMGAAILGSLEKDKKYKRKEIIHSAYGRIYTDFEILKELKKTKDITYKKINIGFTKAVAQMLVQGKVVGWFEGKGEWGPRALGQRSVIADPRNIKTKNRINDILKGREWFMPFAPSMLKESADKYLKTVRKGPFMILADDIIKNNKKDIVAAIHVDDTARPQIVTPEANKLYHEVIFQFKKKTGVGVILNTSFNKHGLPIVYSPRDAIDHLLWKTIDSLAIGNYIVNRKDK